MENITFEISLRDAVKAQEIIQDFSTPVEWTASNEFTINEDDSEYYEQLLEEFEKQGVEFEKDGHFED